jgi:hypothetical protein
VSGPLNPSHIDRVTRKDHDHLALWNDTNTELGKHGTDITTLRTDIAAIKKKLGI